MLELKRRYEEAWDATLRRIGYGDHQAEDFEPWWNRNRHRLANLNAEIAEQWVYRHGSSSPLRFLPLERLAWRQENWSTKQVLDEVHLEFGGPMEPTFDYQVFREGRAGSLETARTWHRGSWNMPIFVLETPAGIHCYDGDLPDVRFVLVEGSKRVRYLNALHHRGDETGPHLLYILTLEDSV